MKNFIFHVTIKNTYHKAKFTAARSAVGTTISRRLGIMFRWLNIFAWHDICDSVVPRKHKYLMALFSNSVKEKYWKVCLHLVF